MDRREYEISPIKINKRVISKVIIDPHYETGHSSYINDELILELVIKLNGEEVLPEDEKGDFQYFSTLLIHEKKQYRLVWLLEEGSIYVGIINAYRDRREN